MSDFPGEMTKQIFAAPPRIIRSTRYSLTARGRSASPSIRLPTGSSSFENASGWILLPIPAAGIMPHIGITRLVGRPMGPQPAIGRLLLGATILHASKKPADGRLRPHG